MTLSKLQAATISWLPIVGLIALLSMAVAVLGTAHRTAHAQTAASGICRAAIVLDVSGSITASQLDVMRNQVRRLFQPTGLYDSKIELAFWTFSSQLAYNNNNYNSPFHDYVSSKGENTSFNAALNSQRYAGSTNYEHGFAYNEGVRNPHLNDIINRTDIIAFLTDGQPNQPILYGGGPVSAARAAVLKHRADGRDIAAGMIGNVSHNQLRQVVNGNVNDGKDIFTVSSSFGDLAAKLRQQIGDKCQALVPPCQYNSNIPSDSPNCFEPCNYNTTIPLDDPRCVRPPYSLTPSVTSDNTVISSTDSAILRYKVENGSPNTSDETEWIVRRLVVERGQSVDPLQYGAGQNYRDGYDCADLRGLVNNRAECSDVASGNKKFGPGETALTPAELMGADTLQIDDRWQVGTKLCYVLVIGKPTDKATPVDRTSQAVCVIVGKRPSVQILGGDLVVGRVNRGDAVAAMKANIFTSTTMKGGSLNRTYGSWAEYGVFAPGDVVGMASASGLRGGYPMTTGAHQEMWSQLTFANTNTTYGHFNDGASSGQTMPDVAASILFGRGVVRDLAGSDALNLNGGDLTSGLYRKQTGDLRLDGSTLEKGKTVIVHVPNGTVTIAGDLRYNEGPYGAITEIPQLIIIAKNIIIAAPVRQVDAWLIARDASGEGGRLVTCDTAGVMTSELCNQTLVVNGPVMARQLELKRTGGAGTGKSSDEPAETFNLRADMYLWGHGEGRSEQRADVTYTTELPPHF